MRRMPPTLSKFLAVYAFLYAAFGVQSPFLPALLREQGLHAEEIGIVLAASTGIRVLAGPAIGHAADPLHRHTSILCGCALAAAVAAGGFDQEDNDPQAEFRSGLRQLLDGIAAKIREGLLGA